MRLNRIDIKMSNRAKDKVTVKVLEEKEDTVYLYIDLEEEALK